MKNRIKLGATVSDRITGYEGVCIGRTEYLTGCDHIAIKTVGLGKDGLPMPSQWFDEPMVRVIAEPDRELLGIIDNSPKPGGPNEHPPLR